MFLNSFAQLKAHTDTHTDTHIDTHTHTYTHAHTKARARAHTHAPTDIQANTAACRVVHGKGTPLIYDPMPLELV